LVDVTAVSAVRGKEESMGGPVVHFEIYGKDASKLQSFYADLFGWEIHADNPMNYGIVHTNSGDKGTGGGITEGDPRVNIVVDVDDLQKYLDTAVSMGAEVVTPITEIPDMGGVPRPGRQRDRHLARRVVIRRRLSSSRPRRWSRRTSDRHPDFKTGVTSAAKSSTARAAVSRSIPG
jgi:predicted enzyme related to lactoylglutathione lyase